MISDPEYSDPDIPGSESEMLVFAASLRVAALTPAAPRLPGADDLDTAVDDLQRRLTAKVTDRELVNCLDCLHKNPIGVVIDNILGDLVKLLFIDRWK